MKKVIFSTFFFFASLPAFGSGLLAAGLVLLGVAVIGALTPTPITKKGRLG